MRRSPAAGRSEEPDFLNSCEPRLAWLYRYWDERRRGRIGPRRADIDPVDFPALLSCILLIDVRHDPLDFVYRVVGTEEVRRRRQDPTGQRISTHYYGPNREDAVGCYTAVCESRRPLYDPRPYRTEFGGYSDEETLFLPLSEDGRRVSQVLVLACRAD
ncbi:MAG: PAS domain-containing protein [Tistlia sp.]|uniref:PAS domain-containing protein n=1 Tax=Tistlia sp. TaxID=3057121 RepID=UPI0034A21C41